MRIALDPFPSPFPVGKGSRGLKNRLESKVQNQYNIIIKAERLLPPRERSPTVAAPPRLDVMTTRLAGWVAFKFKIVLLSTL